MSYPRRIITRSAFTPTGPSANGLAPGIWGLDEVAYWQKQGVWPNPNILSDPSFPYVSFLLSTTALNNANNNLFVDSSGAFNPVSRNGNTTQGSFSPYSTNWSNFFDGSGDYFSVPYTSANFDWWSTDYTIEAWVFPTSLSTWQDSRGFPTMVGNLDPNGETNYWSFGPLANGTVRLYYFNGAGNTVTSTATVSANTWTHIALTKTSSGITIYVNGVASSTTAVSGTPQSSAGFNLVVGQSYGSSVSGYVSNLRIVRGTAVYTSNFTPPTAPLTAITNTKLLTCQSNRFRDASTNNLTLTVTGNTAVQDFSPFSPAYPGAVYNQSDITNWSGYFDGSGDYLSVPSNTAFDLGSSDFTVECWFNSSSFAAGFGLISRYNYSGVGLGWGLIIMSSTVVRFVRGNDIILDCTVSAMSTGAWYHVAAVRSGSTLTVYLNGAQVGQATGISNFTDAATALQIGRTNTVTNDINGYISNARVVKGTAVYTGTFTPPTTNLTAISGTSLLTLQNAAFTDNSTNNFVITPFGNTTVTGNSPFNTVGYWSNYFDGSTSRMSIADNAAFGFGTGNFTIEFWLNYTGGNGYKFFFVNNSGSGNYVGYGLQNGTLTPWVWNNGDVLVASSNITQNTWQHHALVRNGSTLTIYLNGTAIGSTTWTNDLGTSRPFYIGWNGGNNSQSTQGSISNFRVVKGTAVYTANFTPPAAPLTAVTNTSLLTCQNGRFVDNSTNNFSITVSGNTSVQSFDPFYTSTIANNGGSMYFDGSGDFLALQNNPSYALGSGDFTLQVWVYPIVQGGHGSGNNDCIIDFRPASNGPYGTLYSLNNGTSINWYANTAVQITGGPISNGAWSHLMVSRVSGSTRLFINGVQSGSTYTDSTNYLQTNPWIGQFNDGVGNGWFQGYMSGIQIVKGSGVSSNFTPPTAPPAPTPNATLMLNGMNAGVFDATTINDMETVGNAQVRYPSPFAPANYWAGFFDGSGDYLLSPSNSAFALGTGDYTVECWIYATSNPSDVGIYEGRSGGAASDGFTLTAFSSSVIRIFSGGVLVASSGTSYVGQWTHVAVTRASGTTTLWINGVSQGTSSTSYNCTNADAVVGGGRYSGGSSVNTSFPGYISNFRIVKGTAVYTSTFTPSTTPLTAISNTSLLTCQNKTFIDNSSNAFTLTAFGNAAAGAIGPFTSTGGTSVYFDGSGDNLFMPSSPSMNCGSGNWTVEGWVCTFTRTTNYPLIFGNNRGSFTTDALAITASNADSSPSYLDKFVFAWGSAGFSSPSAGNSYLLVSNVTNTNGVWYHLAIVRNGTSIKMYRNGTEVASATVSSGATFNWGFNGSLAGGGNWDGAQGNWNGYLDELRVTNGVARYTANFTPPTQPFPVY